MHRFVASVLVAGVLIAGCSVASVLPGVVDPACQSHPDPADCQAALDTAMAEVSLDLERYVLSVQPITCQGAQCTTWVAAVPDGDDDCIPSYETEVTREARGTWTVTMSTHGDPPCAFEP